MNQISEFNSVKPESPRCNNNKMQESATIVVNLKKLSKKLRDARVLVNVQNSKGCTKGYKEFCLEKLIKLLNE